MGLNEFQGAYRGVVRSDNARLASSIVSSFYGSRATVESMQEFLARLSADTRDGDMISAADVPMPPPEPKPHLEDFGFERVSLEGGIPNAAGTG